MDTAVPPPSDLPPLPDRFEAITKLGDGGQALTLRAHDRTRDRPVAIKILELSRIRDWKAFERFERECTVLQSLDHPSIPAYLEHTRDDERGHVRLVMEWIDGPTLADDLARGRRRSEDQLLALLDRLLDVLDYLHGLHPPVVHRDIKPGNVIVRPDGTPVLVDFGGAAKAFHPEGASTVVGTFGYMAPEQLHGRVTPACDLYALGATLAALAAGEEADQLPRRGLEVDLSAVMHPGPLRSMLAAMLRADPDQRPASVAEMRTRLHPSPPAHATDDPSTLAPIDHGTAPTFVERLDVPVVWSRLSPAQRRKAKIYLGVVWVAIGAAVALRSIQVIAASLVLLVLFPVVMAALGGPDRNDGTARDDDETGR